MSFIVGVGEHIAVHVSETPSHVVGVVGGVEGGRRIRRIEEERELASPSPAETTTDAGGYLLEKVVVDDCSRVPEQGQFEVDTG